MNLTWRIEIKESAQKEIKKLDRQAQEVIIRFLRERVAPDPRKTGKALKGEFGELWRYRIRDYRVICDIQDRVLTVLVVRVADRKEVYRR